MPESVEQQWTRAAEKLRELLRWANEQKITFYPLRGAVIQWTVLQFMVAVTEQGVDMHEIAKFDDRVAQTTIQSYLSIRSPMNLPDSAPMETRV